MQECAPTRCGSLGMMGQRDFSFASSTSTKFLGNKTYFIPLEENQRKFIVQLCGATSRVIKTWKHVKKILL